LKGDKEVVMAAVAQNGSALRWASNKLKSDKEVVSEAVAGYICSDTSVHVAQNGSTAGCTMKGDKHIYVCTGTCMKKIKYERGAIY
jgi:hypothetical protein